MSSFLEPPRLRIGEDSEEERRATWLELFYEKSVCGCSLNPEI